MPLSERERMDLVTRLAECVGDFDGSGGTVIRPDVQAAFAGFLNQATVLVEVATHLMTNAVQGMPVPPMMRATVTPEQETAQPDAAKPRNKGGRPKGSGKKAEGNGAAADAAMDNPQHGHDETADVGNSEDSGDNDPFADPNATQAAAEDDPKTLTEPQVKDILREFMTASGPDGTVKLTQLLMKTAGVKRFSEVPPSKWLTVVRAAKSAMP
jgi:hypothetical protein